MAVTSGFFNSLNGDRRYSAEQFSSIIDNLITNGVFSNVGTAFAVSADSGNNVIVGIGRAWFDSVWIYNDVILPIALPDPEVLLNRIDAIVIEINKNEAVRAGTIKVLEGAPLSSPARPTLTKTGGVFQYPLAYIYRKAGATAVTQSDITNMIGTSDCPFVTGILAVQSIDNIVAQWQSEFDIWFDNLNTSLSGDVAANLASQILDIYSKFDDLAEEKSVYTDITDSSGGFLLDNTGNRIQGRTVLSESEGGGAPVVVDETDSFRIGDILMTTRTDLGSKWLLCNGDPISEVLYPELYERINPLPENSYEQVTIPDIGSETIQEFKFLNSHYILLTNASLYYTSDLSSGWTKSNLTIDEDFRCIEYGNGYWVLMTRDGNPTAYNFYWSTELNGTFTVNDDLRLTTSASVSSLVFGNGNFCYLYDNAGVYLYYVRFSDPATSDKNSGSIMSGKTDINISDFGFYDGYFCFSSSGTSSWGTYSQYETHAGLSRDASSGSWNYVLMSQTTLTYPTIRGASVVSNEKFYASQAIESSSPPVPNPYIYSYEILGDQDDFLGDQVSVGCPANYYSILTKAGDYVIAKSTNDNILLYTRDPSNVNYWTSFSVPVANPTGFIFDGESFFIYDDDVVYKSWKSIPTIAVNGAYAYIKGK